MKLSTTKMILCALICGACGLSSALAAPSVTFNLRADSFTKSVNGRDVLMWGFALGAAAPTSPGPALTVPNNAGTLIINLQNDLDVPVSLVIPNQNGYVRTAGEHGTFVDGAGRTRARSFVKETPPGDTVEYVWENVQPGTYLYFSGSHSALQVQMGLYGMMKKNFAQVLAYQGVPGAPITQEVTWIFGEIDFEVHDAIADGTYETTIKSMIHSVPEVYLLNGEPYQAGELIVGGGNVPLPKLIRMLNACYDERIPMLNGFHLSVIAEDGRKYAYPRRENAVNLPSLKTRDAQLVATPGTSVKFYDRRLLSMQ